MKEIFAGGGAAKRTALLSAALGVGLFSVISAHAQPDIYHLTDNNSTADINVNSGAGMYDWSVEGQNQLAQQWFWYRIGTTAPGNPDAPINSLSTASATQLLSNILKTTYQNSQLKVTISYTLNGQDPGTGGSDIQETIQLKNVSATAFDLHFFQYSDFNLGGDPTGDNVSLNIDSGTQLYSGATQTKGNVILTETVQTGVVPFANHGEANVYSSTLTALGTSYDLNDTTSAGPGDVTWALDWDFHLLPGQQISISKDKLISGVLVPEPGALSFGLAGLGLLEWRLRRRKG